MLFMRTILVYTWIGFQRTFQWIPMDWVFTMGAIFMNMRTQREEFNLTGVHMFSMLANSNLQPDIPMNRQEDAPLQEEILHS